jgi:hypothetical protein
MSSTLASILVSIDTFAGSTAVDYTPGASGCPILGFNCVGSTGAGNVKLTPLSATICQLGASGSGGRLRITTNGSGAITAVEIAAGGTGYTTGPVPVTLVDPFGSGGAIACTASGGAITAASVSSAGSGYSGYVLFDVSDFIEGVTYNIVPRFIEQTSGAGVLRLIGYKLPYRPFQIF